jgi:hypothetical protein
MSDKVCLFLIYGIVIIRWTKLVWSLVCLDVSKIEDLTVDWGGDWGVVGSGDWSVGNSGCKRNK